MSVKSKLIKNKSLSSLSTFQIGGPAKLFIEVKSSKEMAEVRQYINRENIPFWIVGRGSNSLFDDRGFDGLVVLNSICFCDFQRGHLHVGAGYNFSLLGTQMARQGWGNLEFAAGIPGSVGGAIFMNAGAYGVETCDVLTSICYIDIHGQITEKRRDQLVFSYRHSSFHENQGIIVSGSFSLKKCEEARKKQLTITRSRINTQPYGELSAGCIFRNPSIENKAGAIIEKCGLKGKKVGDAEVSKVHANFIVNRGKATAAEVLALVEFIQATVWEKAGIELELEMQKIPFQKRNI